MTFLQDHQQSLLRMVPNPGNYQTVDLYSYYPANSQVEKG